MKLCYLVTPSHWYLLRYLFDDKTSLEEVYGTNSQYSYGTYIAQECTKRTESKDKHQTLIPCER